MSGILHHHKGSHASPSKMEACEFKKYGCGEIMKSDDMVKHLKSQMPTHLMLVVEKFEQQIEMNTFMMAHFTEQMEEQVDKSMQLIQQTEGRQTSIETKMKEVLKVYSKGIPDTSHVDAQFVDIKSKLRVNKESMDTMQTEIERKIHQQGVDLQLLQDRVETNANMLVERLYNQMQNLEEQVSQRTEALDKKIELKEKGHSSYHSLLQDRFEQTVTERQAPIESLMSQLDQKTDRIVEEAKLLQTQLIQYRENTKVTQRQHERLEAEVQVMHTKIDRSSHRRSGSVETFTAAAIQEAGTTSSPSSPQVGVDKKRVENIEAQIKRIDSTQKNLEQTLQAHQTQADQVICDINSKIKNHEESIALEEKLRDRQKTEEKERFKLEEKEREKLEDRIRSEVRQNIDKVQGNVTTLEKLYKSLESQSQSTLVDLRDIKEEIEKNRVRGEEIEEKTKGLKESFDKIKKEDLIDARSKLASKPNSSINLLSNNSPDPKRSVAGQEIGSKPLGSPGKVSEQITSESKPSSSPIVRRANASGGDGEKAILWEYDPVGGKWMRFVITLKMDAKPFAEGALRHAFHAEAIGNLIPADDNDPHLDPFPAADQILPLKLGSPLPSCCDAKTSWIPASKFVVKVYKKDSEQKASRELYFEDVKMQMICRDYGNKFNQKKPPKRIEFLMAWVLELVDRSSLVLCNMEPLLIGEFKKNNSNFGAVLNTRSTPQSFSHFTFEHSRKDLIIVDIQGVEDHYTDPQVHTSDGKGYGLGNLGKNGIQRFLSTHKCNAVCALLGLSPIGMGSTRRPQLRGTMIMPDILSHLPPSDVKVGVRSSQPSEFSRKELKLVQTLQGHRDRISAICYLSSGFVCTASADATIKVYDTNNGWKCVDTLTGHKRGVDCLCANSQYLFSGSADQHIKVWDHKRDFRCVHTLMGHKGEISALCVNSKYIISGSFDKTIKIWSLSTFQEVKTLESHTKSVKCLCLAGSYLFSGSNDLLIYVWDLESLVPIFSLEGHEEWVKAVTMAGQCLVSGSHDSTIKVWDLTEFSCMQTLKGHRDAVVALLTDGSVVYSGSEDNSIKVWDLNTLDCIFTVPKAHPLGIQAFAMVDKKLCSVSVDGSIKVWEWGSK